MKIGDLSIHDLNEDIFVGKYESIDENFEWSIERAILLANLAGRRGDKINEVSVTFGNGPNGRTMTIRYDMPKFRPDHSRGRKSFGKSEE